MRNMLKAIGWLVLNIALQFVVQLAFSVYAVVSGIQDNNAINDWLMVRLLPTVIFSNLLFVVVAMLIYKRNKRNRKDEWKCNNVEVKSYLLPCVIAFTYSMFYSLITYNATANAVSAHHVSAEHYGAFAIPVLALALLVSAPIAEELLCRGIMMNTLKRTFSARIAILVSSAFFGAMHFMAGGFQLAIGAFFMGLIFAIIYQKSNSFYIVVTAHAIANLPDFFLYSSPTIDETLKIVLAILFLIISMVCLWIWYKNKSVWHKM